MGTKNGGKNEASKKWPHGVYDWSVYYMDVNIAKSVFGGKYFWGAYILLDVIPIFGCYCSLNAILELSEFTNVCSKP
jgi:hypothetical protein